MDTIAAFIGFILGVIIFILIFNKLHVFFASFYTIAFLFGISLILGIIIAEIFLWLAIIGIVVCAILWFVLPKKEKPKEEAEQAQDENASADETAEPSEPIIDENEAADCNASDKSNLGNNSEQNEVLQEEQAENVQIDK